jgi:hypothetical protein
MQRRAFMRKPALFVVLVAATGCVPFPVRTLIGWSPVLATDTDAIEAAATILVSEALSPPSTPTTPWCTDDEPDPPHTCPTTVPTTPKD